jgi:hypothetical protein
MLVMETNAPALLPMTGNGVGPKLVGRSRCRITGAHDRIGVSRGCTDFQNRSARPEQVLDCDPSFTSQAASETTVPATDGRETT